MNKYKVFITRKWPASVEAKLQQHYDVTLNEDDHPLSAEEFYEDEPNMPDELLTPQ